ELGHLVAGWLVNFQFVALIVGPVKISKNSNGLTITYSGFKAGQLQGRTLSVPNDAQYLRRRFLWFYAGGPLATLLQLLVMLFIGVLMNGMTISYFARQLFSTFTFASALILLFTIFPYRSQEVCTDGFSLWILLFDNNRTEYIVEFQRMAIASKLGTRLSDLNLEPLLNTLTKLKTAQDKLVIQLLYYRHLLDQADATRAAAPLDQCLDLLSQIPNKLIAVFVFAEAAYYEARYNQNALASKKWLDLAKPIYEKNQWLVNRHILKRAESATLLAEGDLAGGYLAAQEGLKLLEQCADPGYVQSERDWLTQLAEEGEPPLEDAVIITQNESRQEAATWLIAKSATGTLLYFGLFFVASVIVFGLILNKDLRYQLIGTYYIRTENYSKAIDYYSQGLEDVDSDEGMARLYLQRSRAFLQQHEYKPAIDDLTQAIKLWPRGRYYLERGIAYYQYKNYFAATFDLNDSLALELDEDEQVTALFYRAAAHTRLKDYDLAIEDYETLLTLSLDTTERQRAQTALNEIKAYIE
ncbi:MAG: hypothetical protein KDJ52_35040, partial [Anaerolineae bacterium]|nr:hypothetical protein [Anaerolineae bacterium]